MLIRDARAVARRWVIEQGSRTAGFCAAYLAGSTNGLPPDSPVAPTSDVDVMVVASDPGRAAGREKFIYRDVLLDVTYVPGEQLASADSVLADYHLAAAFGTVGLRDNRENFVAGFENHLQCRNRESRRAEKDQLHSPALASFRTLRRIKSRLSAEIWLM